VGPDDFDIGGAATLPADDAVGLAYNARDHEYLVTFRARIGGAGGEYEIFGQRLGLDGSERGPNDFRISDMGPDATTSFVAQPPRVTWNSRLDQYLVVWTGDDDTAPLVDGEFEAFGQLLTAVGSQIGPNDFRISDMGPNGDTDYSATGARVAYDANSNRYLVVWHGDDNTSPLVDDKFEIFGQDLRADGAQIGTNDFRISHMPPEGVKTSDALRPAVAYNPRACNFLTTWFRGTPDFPDSPGDSTGEAEVYDRRVAEPACPAGPTPPGVDDTAPVISGLRFAPGTLGTKRTRRLRTKGKISYRLSEAARVRFGIYRRTIGRKVGKRCRKKTRRNRSRRRCVRYVKVGRSFTQNGKAGKNSRRFSRKTIKKRRLSAGRYRVLAIATDSAGNRSKKKRAKFRVKRVKQAKRVKRRPAGR